MQLLLLLFLRQMSHRQGWKLERLWLQFAAIVADDLAADFVAVDAVNAAGAAVAAAAVVAAASELGVGLAESREGICVTASGTRVGGL